MFEQFSDDPLYNVKAIANQTGVAAATLRAWERRYGVPAPPRTHSGYRLYSARDAARVRWLKGQIENGMSISQAVQLLKAVEAQLPSSNGAPPAKTPESAPPASLQRLHDEIVAAAIEFDEERIERALNEGFTLFAVEDVCLNVMQPALVTLGERWHAGEINVGVEHFTTHLMRRKLLSLIAMSPAPTREARIVSGCAPSEYHELGLLILSLFLRRAGHPLIYLGQSISITRLDETLQKVQPRLVLLSASGLVAAASLLDVAEDLQAQRKQKRWSLAYGGRIFNVLPQLQARVPGLFLGEDARIALQQIGAFLARAPESPAQPITPPGVLQEALTEFRMRRHDVLAGALRHNPMLEHRFIMSAGDNLIDVIEAALRFNAPEVLRQPSQWRWDALPPDGMTDEQLRACAGAVMYSIQHTLPAQTLTHLQPFLAELQAGVREH
jgi:DNA-binding transcriptional MerR regulator